MELPIGFRYSGCHCGIKQRSTNEDLSLIVTDRVGVAAGVYTKNQIVAPPVVLDRERTPMANFRALVVNSGNANACTGEQGMANARRMTELVAQQIECHPDQVLVMSTGIIGVPLPMEKVERGIDLAASQLQSNLDGFSAAARGIMTTDTVKKVSFREIRLTHSTVRLAGMAKGSGMIGPNMATMLGAILTDANLTAEQAQQALSGASELSFNSIHVDGHVSTNDSVILIASGRGASEADLAPMSAPDFDTFCRGLHELSADLAKQIVYDGEGASHFIEIRISGAQTDVDAKLFAASIANSPLVKTAFAGNDPNWGRIVSAAGYAAAPLDPQATSLRLNGVELFRHGTPVPFDAAAVSAAMSGQKEVLVELVVGSGSGSCRFWTCDLTHQYVTINADYHT